ncbi:MAG TPA: carbohydrate ABC transporter permease [Clostridia bacterium]|nr:carbohydrate ABC transporter permease [Clostridia bacterium]
MINNNRIAKKISYKTLIWVLVIIYVLFVTFPFYWMFLTAVKSQAEIYKIPPNWWPETFAWNNFIDVWSAFPIARYFANTIFITLTTTILGISLATLAAYSMWRYKFKGVTFLMMVLLLTQMLPKVVTITPFYFWMLRLGLVNNYLGLILAYTTWSLPFSTLMLRSYFGSTFPVELEESALVDGCTRFQAFYKIVLPVSAPGLVAAGTFAFMLAWREFMFASIMLNKGKLKPLAVGLFDMMGQSGEIQYISMFMASAVMTTIPVILLFLFGQKYIIQGLTSGAVKG